MDIQNFIAEFKKTFVYDILKDYVSDEKLFDHVVDDTKVIWMKEQTRQMWSMWQAAKAQAVPEGFVLVEKELPESIAEAMALERVNKPFGETDPAWVEITEKVYCKLTFDLNESGYESYNAEITLDKPEKLSGWQVLDFDEKYFKRDLIYIRDELKKKLDRVFAIAA